VLIQGVRVLVVDDEAPIRELLRAALEGDGYEVATATNGATALDAAVAFAPDVILLDMRMPVMDGRSFVEAYRRVPVPRLAPIVLVTAAVDGAARADQLRAAGFLAKPFDLDQVESVIARVCAEPRSPPPRPTPWVEPPP
jgi:CheY-like chemotaxis protein